MALPAQEPFTGATANLADPPWKVTTVTGVNHFIKKDGSGNGTVTGAGTDDLETWDNDTFANDQYSQYVAKFTGPSGSADYIYLIARVTGTEHNTWTTYWFWSDGGSDTALIKSVAGTGTTLATANATTYVSGDVFRLICVGTAISVTKNGSTILSATDSSVTSGVAGMGGAGVSGTLLFDDWEGGNVATGLAMFHMSSGQQSEVGTCI